MDGNNVLLFCFLFCGGFFAILFIIVLFLDEDIRKKIFKKKGKYEKFIELCADFIDEYEEPCVTPSCKEDVLTYIKRTVEPMKADFNDPNFSEKEFRKLASTLLFHACFDLLTSGRYHIFSGVLNPLGKGNSILAVFKGNMNFAVENDYITVEQKEEQTKQLMSHISEIG